MSSLPTRTIFFAGIADRTRLALEAIEKRQHIDSGALIFRQGEPATFLILVISGLVKIWRTAEDGTAITLALLGPGEPIGTLHISREMPLTASVGAHGDTEIACWPLDAFKRIIAEDPAFQANISNIVARYAVRMIDRLEEVSTVPVEQRVARALCRSCGIALPNKGVLDLPLSRQDIADMSSTTLPTVSRTMARWREEGLIGGHRGHIHLLDLAGLRAIAAFATIEDETLAISIEAP